MAQPEIFGAGASTLTPPNGFVEIDNGGAQINLVRLTSGTVTLNGTTPVTVTNANVTPNSIIDFTLKTVGGTVGAQPVIQTITPGTGFTVSGTAADTSIYNYLITG